jgi:hypothetical protein
MAWERRGSGRYYYHKRRTGRTVRSEYVGSGEVAHAVAALDAAAARRRVSLLEERKREREECAALDARLDAVLDLTQAFVGALLAERGYHKHKGQWRRRRGKK